MATATLVGSTGQVVRPHFPTLQLIHLLILLQQGSSILTHLLAHPSFSAIYAYARRDLPNPTASTKLNPITSTDTTQWASLFPREMHPKIMFSGLGTTRADAGGFENQRKIDYDLNMEVARAAKDAGVETYVLISTTGANAGSMFAYPKMKGELENSIIELGFKNTVFLRPGFIAGERTSREAGAAEVGLRWIAKGLGGITPALKNFWAQDGDLIGRAAVVAGVTCVEGKREEGLWELGQADIVRLGGELEKKP